MKDRTAAPAQRDMFTKRYRTVRAPDPYEHQIQISLVAHLRWRVRKGVTYYHVPNGEERDKRVASKLKAMGVRPGVSDLVFEYCDDAGHLCVLHLELKREGKRRTDEQVDFCVEVRALGAYYEVADNIDDAIATLQRYRLLR